MTYYAVTGLINAITATLVGLFVISRHQSDIRRITFAAFVFSVAAWGYCYFLWQLADSEAAGLWWARGLMVGAIAAPACFFHHAVTLVRKERVRRYAVLIRFGYASSCVFLALVGTPLVVKNVARDLSFAYWPKPGVLFYVYTVFFWLYFFIGARLLYRGYRSARGVVRGQLRVLLIGSVIAFLGAGTNFLLWYEIPVAPIGNVVVPFYVLLAAYAIMKYQLMDIRIAFTRTGLLLGTYLIVLGVPFIVGWHGRVWLEALFPAGWWLVPLSLSTVLATIGPFVYAYLRRQAEARLLKEQRHYQRILRHAARGMTRVRNVSQLANLITRTVSQSVRLTHASLFIWDKTGQRYVLRASHGPQRLAVQPRSALQPTHALVRWLKDRRRILIDDSLGAEVDPAVIEELRNLKSALAVPGLIEQDLEGFLTLGPKLSGAGYSEDDLHAFSTLANEAAIAIENATSYEELVKANERLKAATERLLAQERLAAVGRFATGMAHEIKNPLAAIKTFVQYLPEKYANREFRDKFFRIVKSEIDRINGIVNDLSSFAKPSPLQLQPVHVGQLTRETLALLSDQCLKQGVDVSTSFKENGFSIHADPQQLKQVLLNILLNSLEAMGQGGRLRVSTHASGSYLMLRVADTGSGIPKECQATIWDPFFTTKETGMGLGLAVVQSVVERHGGHVTLASEPGKGTTIQISLPLSRQPSSRRPRRAQRT